MKAPVASGRWSFLLSLPVVSSLSAARSGGLKARLLRRKSASCAIASISLHLETVAAAAGRRGPIKLPGGATRHARRVKLPGPNRR